MNVFTTYHEGLDARLLELTTDPSTTNSLADYQQIESNCIREHLRIHVGFWRLKSGTQTFTSPVEIPKSLSTNVPLIMAILKLQHRLPALACEGMLILGNLQPDNSILPVPSVFNSAIAASEAGFHTMVVPKGQGWEASKALTSLKIVEVSNLSELLTYLVKPKSKKVGGYKREKRGWRDLAQRVLTIAAAGNHPLLLRGSNTTALSIAGQLLSLLPTLNRSESREVARLMSSMMAFKDPIHRPFVTIPPLASSEGLFGSAAEGFPGRVVTAHHGVLFLEDVTRLGKSTVKDLFKVHQDKVCNLISNHKTIRFPANFFLVAGTEKPSLPLYLTNRFPLVLTIPSHLPPAIFGETIGKFREQVQGVHHGQWGPAPRLCTGSQQKLKKKYSPSQVKRILSVAATIATLEGDKRIAWNHVKEAAKYH